MKSESNHYKEAGVDINAGYRAVELMKDSIRRTMIPGADTEIGGFGGLFSLDLTGYQKPVLVSGTDGVGTKLKLAFLSDIHHTVGIDCVAMCVNDILCSGAKPLFFLDYIAVGKNIPERVAQVVSGVAEGCVQAGCALIGGETAEMPGFYPEDEYDLAGFAVGLVDRDRMIDKQKIKAGDIILALPSSGLHSNGFSLARKVFDIEHADLMKPLCELDGISLCQALLAPTCIYVKPVLHLMEEVSINGMAHITGGGFYENIPRTLPGGFSAHIDKSAWVPQKVFSLLAQKGEINEREMFSTFNMGVGLCIVVDKREADKALHVLHEKGQAAFVLGEVRKGSEGVVL